MAVVQQVMIVTGAGGGMGKAILQHQLAQGNIVVGLDLSVASLAELAHENLQTYEATSCRRTAFRPFLRKCMTPMDG